MLRPSIRVGLMVLLGAVLAKDQERTDEPLQPTGRFGFSFLEPLRRSLCDSSFCMSADTMPYFVNLMCAAKCPELYLPHGTTTPANALPIPLPPTTTPATVTTTSTMAPSNVSMNNVAPSNAAMNNAAPSNAAMNNVAPPNPAMNNMAPSNASMNMQNSMQG